MEAFEGPAPSPFEGVLDSCCRVDNCRFFSDVCRYKNYHCKVSSVQNKTAGEPCAQSVTKDRKEVILCRPYPILHWKHILFSARGKTPLHDCIEENMTKFFSPLCCTSLGVKRHCVIAYKKI